MNQLQHFRGNEEFAKRIYDQIDQMQRYQRVIITPFFTPEEARITQIICGKQTAYGMSGGYVNAERVRFAFLPYADDQASFPTICLKATFSTAFSTLSHRDVLGALMNLGMERDAIGDLILQEGKIYVFCDEKVENYICCNLTRIKRCTIHFQRCEEELQHEQEMVEETRIVSSLRLDVLVSSLAHVARGKANEMIRAGLIKVDHVIQNQPSFFCKEQATISIRGKGRFQFVEVKRNTKKDHLIIEIKRYT